jgi:hypothetical protein
VRAVLDFRAARPGGGARPWRCAITWPASHEHQLTSVAKRVVSRGLQFAELRRATDKDPSIQWTTPRGPPDATERCRPVNYPSG